VGMTRCSLVLLCLSALLGCEVDSDGVSPQRSEAGCDVRGACLTRAFEFGSVVVGDTATTSVSITNPPREPYTWPRLPLEAEVLPSSCPDFSWDSGMVIVEEGSSVIVPVWYHPTAPGGHRCEIRTILCQNVFLSGTGVTELGTLVQVCSFAGSEVRVTVSYDLGGSRDSVATNLPAFGGSAKNCADTYVPVGATNVGIHAAYRTGSAADPWVTIFRTSFPEPVRKCYVVTETSWGEGNCLDTRCPGL